jgi:hypothetical protein
MENKNPTHIIPITEKIFMSFGACDEAVQFIKQNDMFGKPYREIKQFLIDSGKSDWIERWDELHMTPAVFELIKRRYLPEYYTSKFFVNNPITKEPDIFATLEEAVEQQKINQSKYLTLIKDLFISDGQFFDIVNNCVCDSLEIAHQNYIKTHSNIFLIKEEMTTIDGEVLVRNLT